MRKMKSVDKIEEYVVGKTIASIKRDTPNGIYDSDGNSLENNVLSVRFLFFTDGSSIELTSDEDGCWVKNVYDKDWNSLLDGEKFKNGCLVMGGK